MMPPITYQHIKNFSFMISRTIIIRASVVYREVLIQSRGSSVVFTYRKADVRGTPYRQVTLGIVPFELSISISGIHAATYVVNVCVY